MARRIDAPRLGGEIPAFSDRYGPPLRWQANWLPFSHGRAALAWLLDRIAAHSALACAYTCPSVPAFLRQRDLALALFDIGATARDIAARARALPAPRLVLVPALFGSPPWLDPRQLAAALQPGDCVVIDAAQTAFGHADFAMPAGGAVLSCPRKTTALADGAVLALAGGLGTRADTERLPLAIHAAALKLAARALWAAGDPRLEAGALAFSQRSERSWPPTPHRMSDASRLSLERLDRQWHAEKRRVNRGVLARALGSALPVWASRQGTPFSLPVFVAEPQAALDRLHRHRIFASRLWPDADYDAGRHRAAAWMARHLLSLPVDQRHDAADMKRVAEAVTEAASPPRQSPPPTLHSFVTKLRGRRRQ